MISFNLLLNFQVPNSPIEPTLDELIEDLENLPCEEEDRSNILDLFEESVSHFLKCRSVFEIKEILIENDDKEASPDSLYKYLESTKFFQMIGLFS